MASHPPSRIVSLAPSNTEILFALGLQDSVVAVTEYCDFPPEALQKPRLRGWVSMDPKDILSHRPDLVVTSTICQKALREKLEQAGIPLLHLDPRDLGSVRASFFELGKATDRGKEASALAEIFDRERHALREARRPGSYRPRVYCEEWQRPPAVSGNWVPELMAEAGARYFPIAPGELSRPVTAGEVAAFDPEIVILSICGAGLTPDPSGIARRPGWEKLDAVRKKRVFTLEDSLFNRPGPRLWEGARLVQDLLRALGGAEPFPDPAFLRKP